MDCQDYFYFSCIIRTLFNYVRNIRKESNLNESKALFPFYRLFYLFAVNADCVNRVRSISAGH